MGGLKYLGRKVYLTDVSKGGESESWKSKRQSSRNLKKSQGKLPGGTITPERREWEGKGGLKEEQDLFATWPGVDPVR